jgi:DNA polymerase
MARVLHFDYETFSPLDLRKVGMYRYAEEAEILMVAYAFEDGEVQVVDVAQGEPYPQEFLDALTDDETLIYAHNASFERVITKACLGIDIPLHKVRCTAVWAAYLGLPRQLDKLSEVLKLGDKAKLKIGKQLITKFCKPRKPTKKNPSTRLMPADDPVNWELFKEYNRQDVVAEMEVHRKFARWPMPDSEWRMYHKDQEINDRGIRVDMRLVNQAIKLASQEREQLMARAREITNLDNPNSRDQLLAWLETEDVFTQTLTKKDVLQIIGSTTNEVVLELMTIRQQLAKASVMKYEAVARSVCKDGRIRGTLLFYGAGTGRWSGQLLQPQNMPSKGLLKPDQIAIAREMLKLEESMIGLLFDDTARVLSSLLRPMLNPSEGNTFGVADFSAIEGRITAWLANEVWRLELFAKGGKLYETSAERMFNLSPGSVKKGDPMRDKGKVSELALGYQGWEGALITMGALDMGLTLEELAPLASAWREANPAIVAYWYGCEKAAIRAMQNPQVLVPIVTDYQPVGHAGYLYDGHFLRAVLPNGRELYYAMPKLGRNKRDKLAVSYWGVDSETKKWAQQWLYGGLMLENICQAVARDCLVESLIGFDKETTPVVFHVHDELIAELENPGQLGDLLDVMAKPLPWAPGLLLKGDGYTTEYYFKED